MNTTKLKAFTLYEMLVAMVVSAIVIAIAASIFILVSKQFNSFKQHATNQTKIRQLHYVLTNEMAWSNSVYLDQNYRTVTFSNDLKKSIISFDYDMVIFKNDTIAENIMFLGLFEDKEVEYGYIDALKVYYSIKGVEKQMFYSKEYDSEFYMNKQVIERSRNNY